MKIRVKEGDVAIYEGLNGELHKIIPGKEYEIKRDAIGLFFIKEEGMLHYIDNSLRNKEFFLDKFSVKIKPKFLSRNSYLDDKINNLRKSMEEMFETLDELKAEVEKKS